MRFPASARLPCCVHAPAAISVLPSKPPAPSRRIPARAYDPCTKHRGSQSSKAPQPEVRGDHPRCSHTQCRHAPQAWGAKHLHTLTAHLPPSQSRRIGMYPLSPCFVSASDQQRAVPAQSSCTHTIRRKAVDHVYSPAVLTCTKLL